MSALTGLILAGAAGCAPAPASSPTAPAPASVAATVIAASASAPPAAASSPPAAAAPIVRSPAAQPAQRVVPTPTGDDVIVRVNAGIESAFEQGEPIPLTGDVLAEFRISRGREKFPRDLDVFLYRGTPDNTIDDAVVGVNGAMVDMEHASFRLRVPPEGGGRYVLMMPTIMPGRWTLDITVKTGGKDVTTRIVVETFD